VTDAQGLKLTGLIGVKRDAGLVLHSRLDELQVESARREGPQLVVETRERWSYADRRIGSGEVVGEPSTDTYALRYVFVRQEGRWKLDRLEFREEPRVGRKVAPLQLDARTAHGVASPEAAEGAEVPREAGSSPSAGATGAAPEAPAGGR
jgi:hypothetical protein